MCPTVPVYFKEYQLQTDFPTQNPANESNMNISAYKSTQIDFNSKLKEYSDTNIQQQQQQQKEQQQVFSSFISNASAAINNKNELQLNSNEDFANEMPCDKTASAKEGLKLPVQDSFDEMKNSFNVEQVNSHKRKLSPTNANGIMSKMMLNEKSNIPYSKKALMSNGINANKEDSNGNEEYDEELDEEDDIEEIDDEEYDDEEEDEEGEEEEDDGEEIIDDDEEFDEDADEIMEEGDVESKPANLKERKQLAVAIKKSEEDKLKNGDLEELEEDEEEDEDEEDDDEYEDDESEIEEEFEGKVVPNGSKAYKEEDEEIEEIQEEPAHKDTAIASSLDANSNSKQVECVVADKIEGNAEEEAVQSAVTILNTDEKESSPKDYATLEEVKGICLQKVKYYKLWICYLQGFFSIRVLRGNYTMHYAMKNGQIIGLEGK